MGDEQSNSGPVGAALLIGGGTAARRAALGVADARIKTQVLGCETAISRLLARPGKTFPTNHFAMSITFPQIVDVARQINIEVLTSTELDSLDGQAGSFVARSRINPRYVHLDKAARDVDAVPRSASSYCPVNTTRVWPPGTLSTDCIRRPSSKPQGSWTPGPAAGDRTRGGLAHQSRWESARIDREDLHTQSQDHK